MLRNFVTFFKTWCWPLWYVWFGKMDMRKCNMNFKWLHKKWKYHTNIIQCLYLTWTWKNGSTWMNDKNNYIYYWHLRVNFCIEFILAKVTLTEWMILRIMLSQKNMYNHHSNYKHIWLYWNQYQLSDWASPNYLRLCNCFRH